MLSWFVLTVVLSLASECHGHGYQVTQLNVFDHLKFTYQIILEEFIENSILPVVTTQ